MRVDRKIEKHQKPEASNDKQMDGWMDGWVEVR
jgi:hypothetical protein